MQRFLRLKQCNQLHLRLGLAPIQNSHEVTAEERQLMKLQGILAKAVAWLAGQPWQRDERNRAGLSQQCSEESIDDNRND
ncbi:hypothetical protein RGR602_PB00356 (plasmid) [Rhizobium gallicum bv. gallicum R602sp]|uniref:Uncharacterized protein n=1 Tax=Rhizobium gallicum bv. gallicum R602sp TaxID=1041138 RepID=A0A0B4XBB8_9HYPH|nr:hypothetical protein RGR602_PB00356 [Rhizobium gallicum bv. gallicum R602sp]